MAKSLLFWALLVPVVVGQELEPWERQEGYGSAHSRVGSYYNGPVTFTFEHHNITSGALADNADVCEDFPSLSFEFDGIFHIGVPHPRYSKGNAFVTRLISWSKHFDPSIIDGEDPEARYKQFILISDNVSGDEPNIVLESSAAGPENFAVSGRIAGGGDGNGGHELYANFTEPCSTNETEARYSGKRYLADGQISSRRENSTRSDGTPVWPTLIKADIGRERATWNLTASIGFLGRGAEDSYMFGNLTIAFDGTLDSGVSDEMIFGKDAPEWKRTVGASSTNSSEEPPPEDFGHTSVKTNWYTVCGMLGLALVSLIL